MADPQRIARESIKKLTQATEEGYGSMEQLTEQLQERAAEINKRVKEYSKQAGQYARQNPGSIAAVLLLVSGVAGLILWRRRNSRALSAK